VVIAGVGVTALVTLCARVFVLVALRVGVELALSAVFDPVLLGFVLLV
jgi:hypothetical protein